MTQDGKMAWQCFCGVGCDPNKTHIRLSQDVFESWHPDWHESELYKNINGVWHSICAFYGLPNPTLQDAHEINREITALQRKIDALPSCHICQEDGVMVSGWYEDVIDDVFLAHCDAYYTIAPPSPKRQRRSPFAFDLFPGSDYNVDDVNEAPQEVPYPCSADVPRTHVRPSEELSSVIRTSAKRQRTRAL